MTTRDEIIKMAREAGVWREHTNTWMCSTEDLERFFHMVCASEREACAKLIFDIGSAKLAAAIRSRSEIDSIVQNERSARGQA